MIDNIATLKKAKSLHEVHRSAYFQEHFIKKYINDIPRMALDLFGIELTYQQLEVLENHDWEGGRQVVPSGHGTGKTKIISIIALAHMLLFPKSITRIQAPKADQVTKFSFKEIKTNLAAMESPFRVNDRIVVSEWAFLAYFVQANDTLIYVKGFKQGWYIEPATAPRGDPTNLSGQHNMFYLLMFDECSGIPDEHIDASLGALSERFNSCIAFSQHTRTSGRFHEWVTTRSVEHGGVWKVTRLNAEQSPRVTAKAIMNWRATYTENEYQVRVLGLPPMYEDGYLLNSMEATKVYSREGKGWIDQLYFHTITVSTDIAYTGLRDSSVVTQMKVAVNVNLMGQVKLYVVVEDIDVYHGRNKKLPTEVSEMAYQKLLLAIEEAEQKAQFLRLPIDATAGGHEAYVKLNDLVTESDMGDAYVQPIIWGNGRLTGYDKRRFANQRAKANIMLKEAVTENRLYIATKKYRTRILNELSHIPFKFTIDFKYKILSKEEMAKQGIKSPDIIDTLSQQFLVSYVATEEDQQQQIEETEDLNPDELFPDEEMNLDEKTEDDLGLYDKDDFDDFETTLITT